MILFTIDIIQSNTIQAFYGAFINGGILFQKIAVSSAVQELFQSTVSVSYFRTILGETEREFELILDQQRLTLTVVALKMVGDTSNPTLELSSKSTFIKPSNSLSKNCSSTKDFLFCLYNDNFAAEYASSYLFWSKTGEKISIYDGENVDPLNGKSVWQKTEGISTYAQILVRNLGHLNSFVVTDWAKNEIVMALNPGDQSKLAIQLEARKLTGEVYLTKKRDPKVDADLYAEDLNFVVPQLSLFYEGPSELIRLDQILEYPIWYKNKELRGLLEQKAHVSKRVLWVMMLAFGLSCVLLYLKHYVSMKKPKLKIHDQ